MKPLVYPCCGRPVGDYSNKLYCYVCAKLFGWRQFLGMYDVPWLEIKAPKEAPRASNKYQALRGWYNPLFEKDKHATNVELFNLGQQCARKDLNLEETFEAVTEYERAYKAAYRETLRIRRQESRTMLKAEEFKRQEAAREEALEEERRRKTYTPSAVIHHRKKLPAEEWSLRDH